MKYNVHQNHPLSSRELSNIHPYTSPVRRVVTVERGMMMWCFLARVRKLLCTTEKLYITSIARGQMNEHWENCEFGVGGGLIAEQARGVVPWCNYFFHIAMKKKGKENFSSCYNKIIKDAHTKRLEILWM